MRVKDSKISYNPYTPSRRFMTKADFSELTTKKPYKKLLIAKTKLTGRDKFGHISVAHRGGGNKRKLRLLTTIQDKKDLFCTVKTIEYDPNRTARIMLLEFEDKTKIYSIAPYGIKINQKIICSEDAKIKTGNRLKLKNIPVGTEIYEVEIEPNSRGKLIKSAGCCGTIIAQAEGEGKRANYIQIKMPSGEIRLLHKECFASIGKVSNINNSNIKIGKAGRSRWMRRRPVVRGKAKNPVDHPHGGGEGGNSIGLVYPKTPWGKPAMGYKTRKNKRTEKFIIKHRNQK